MLLLKQITEYQKEFFTFAGIRSNEIKPLQPLSGLAINSEPLKSIIIGYNQISATKIAQPTKCSTNTKKPRKKLPLRNYRTRKDPFATVWDSIAITLALNPHHTAKLILTGLITTSPEIYNLSMLRTLSRRISSWRKRHLELDRLDRLSSLDTMEQNNEYLIKAIIS